MDENEHDRYLDLDLASFFTSFRDKRGVLTKHKLGKASAEPIVDELTRKAATCYHPDLILRGIRDRCPGCGARHSGRYHFSGEYAVHLFAYHRADLSDEVLTFIESLSQEGVDLSDEALVHPKQ